MMVLYDVNIDANAMLIQDANTNQLLKGKCLKGLGNAHNWAFDILR